MRDDILRCYPQVDPDRVHVVHNGIDLSGWQRPAEGSDEAAGPRGMVRELGIDPDRPSVVFVGRITRQKGLPYFLRAAELLPPEVQVVLCAGAPDTPEIHAEVTALVEKLARDAHRRRVDLAHAAARRARRRARERHRVRVPVGLRAARHRQPRGDGGRPAGGRHRDRRHPRGGRRRRRPASSCRSTRRRTAPAHRSTPSKFVADLADALTRVTSDPARAAEMGVAARHAGRGPLLVGRDRATARIEVYRSVVG